MHTNNHFPKTTASIIVILLLAISPFIVAQATGQQLTDSAEYKQFVHSTPRENSTYIDKPIFPIVINNAQIEVGQSWTITCPLEANHNYHIYCYGSWVSTSSTAKTDYDIYVSDPAGNSVSSHTEAAGFPEHLSSQDNDKLFTPKQNGDYTFMIKNDDRESQGAQEATFMIIENLECNKWYTTHIEGKADDSTSQLHTTEAYELVTNESKLEVYLKIPDSLDMYEARLYLMNDQNSPSINGFLLPLESGLYGNVSGVVGGYNFETEGNRGITYASCEKSGQDMFLNYTSANSGLNLYHLVLIGEEGLGNVEFMMKTDFANSTLSQVGTVGRVLPDAPVKIAYKTSDSALEKANLTYSVDDWATVNLIPMIISNQTCNATIPSQKTGTTVQYRVSADDVIKNHLETTGNYSVKTQPTLDIYLVDDTVIVGQNITVRGTLSPNDNDSKIFFQYFSANATESLACEVASNGTFTADFAPAEVGNWAITASSPESKTAWRGDGPQLVFTVSEPPIYVKYQMFIVIGLVVALAVGGAVYYLKFRRR